MWPWFVLPLLILGIPCYFAALQGRELVRAWRAGELKCPVRRERRDRLEFAE